MSQTSFEGDSLLAKRLVDARGQIRTLVEQAGGCDVRVFGSVATHRDCEDSDIDLLFDPGSHMSLMDIARLEIQISELVGAPVDLVPEGALRRGIRDRVLREAVHL